MKKKPRQPDILWPDSMHVYVLTTIINVNTTTLMRITYDPAKNEANIAKHGVALSEAASIEWESALVWRDERRDYGEPRCCAIGYIDMRLYFVAFATRAESRRIISLRKANDREVRRYAEA